MLVVLVILFVVAVVLMTGVVTMVGRHSLVRVRSHLRTRRRTVCVGNARQRQRKQQHKGYARKQPKRVPIYPQRTIHYRYG